MPAPTSASDPWEPGDGAALCRAAQHRRRPQRTPAQSRSAPRPGRTVSGGEGQPHRGHLPDRDPPAAPRRRPRRPRSVSNNVPERPRRHIRGRGAGRREHGGLRRRAGTDTGRAGPDTETAWAEVPRAPAGRLLPWPRYVSAGGLPAAGRVPRSSHPERDRRQPACTSVARPCVGVAGSLRGAMRDRPALPTAEQGFEGLNLRAFGYGVKLPDLGASAHCRLQFGGLRLLRYRLSSVFAVAGSGSLKCGVPAFLHFGVFSYFIGNEIASTSLALQASSHGVYFVC